MSSHIRGTIKFVEGVENFLVNCMGWFILVHDGSQSTEEKYGEPSFFTKVYRMRLPDGVVVHTWVKFLYNYRDNWADFTVSWRDPIGEQATAKEIASRRLVRAMKSTQEIQETQDIQGIQEAQEIQEAELRRDANG